MRNVLLVLIWGVLAGCGRQQGAPSQGDFVIAPQQLAQCGKDTDCKGDRICQKGQCVNPALPVAASPILHPVLDGAEIPGHTGPAADFHSAIGKTYSEGRKILIGAGFKPSLNYAAQADEQPPFQQDGFPEAGSCRGNCVTVFSASGGKCWDVLTNFTDKITSNHEGVIAEITPSRDCGQN